MYMPFFGLTQAPFSLAPDPRLLFMSDRHREALAHLLYGLGGGGGFVLLTGEIGTGKTTVCRCFLEQIPAHCNVAYIFNPKLTVTELLQSICDEFHVTVPQKELLPLTVKDYLDPLNTFLLQAHAAGQNNVLIIDEAQNLSAEVLEQLRLLTNLETSERKLLQIVLIGQPELRTMLQRPELEQLAQRVIARFHLDALTEAETAQYILHRLEVSGLNRALPFDRKALKRIHQRARGVPRRINLLCDRALLGAFAGGQATVNRGIVNKAADEVFDPPVRASSLTWRWQRSLALVGLSVAAGAGLLATARLATQTPQAPHAPEIAAVATPTDAAAPAAVAASGPVMAAAAADATLAPPTPPAPPAQPPILLRDEGQAWRELAQAWKLTPGEGDPCQALQREQVRCFSSNTSLALIRQLGRPGIVKLDSQSGSPSYALLTALTDDSATLRAGGIEQTVTLAALAARWQGDFSTLWRSPAGYGGRPLDSQSGPVVEWVAARLTAVDGTAQAGRPVLDASLRARLRTFQLAQGLPTDGRLGPLTFMQLNRTAGVDEPRLRTGP
ncbi:ExeA family protein [Polaromonas sp. JS666]|uniref:ExeA family protein n=1 Tax=Polaromonas sp. (strain JS666 / ATCC BAA-500) TaxID=296591 RepID=UPI0000463E7D|nr:ExeA family protein [Polaromonas sp. JS666]ABE44738.1 Peptidoglycan-binding domain 1 [Polaromonas sp. JS666]